MAKQSKKSSHGKHGNGTARSGSVKQQYAGGGAMSRRPPRQPGR